ncbi:iron-containing alcohol dehydrogenase [Halalkalibacterium ligniniphilum]|uniref:iron-containing alcohol dehydrogenase n=1 Tax=Halalkalibacterium ligniniphilum TaxID=1134413 RepID=UPI00034C7DC2|nr:iron-containing alcohol dehydrogenase [Halalkalibacterium ligniniphilum]
MYTSFNFHLPTRIQFGYEKVKELKNLPFQANRAFIVTDKGVEKAGLLNDVIDAIKQANMTYKIYRDVEPDPSVETVDKAAKAFAEAECDLLIAVGGGSPIDTAKGVRVVASNGGSIRNYSGVNLVKEAPSVPLVAIPTTAGTGSEVTIFAVFSDDKENRKVTVTSSHLSPDVSIIDPKLTLTAPPSITAAAGFDAFAHAAEAFVSRISQPPSDALALSAMKTVHTYLRRAVYNGDDIEARMKMAEASLLAGMAFNQSYLGLAHAIGSAISVHAHVSHGVVIGLLLPKVIEYNLVAKIDKYAEAGKYIEQSSHGLSNYEAAALFSETVTQLRNDIGLPKQLREVNVKEAQLEAISKDSIKSGMWQFNPRRASEQDVYQMLREML